MRKLSLVVGITLTMASSAACAEGGLRVAAGGGVLQRQAKDSFGEWRRGN